MKNNVVSLPDIQHTPDERGIDLQCVGVKDVEIPLNIAQKDGGSQLVHALATTSVGLPKKYKGTHMSRFIMQLAEWSRGKVLSLSLKEFLEEARVRLQAESAQIKLDFRYFIEKEAPVSKISAPMAYACSFKGVLEKNGNGDNYHLDLSTTVPISTLCPCSKAISKYGAHNQRTEIRTTVQIDTKPKHPVVWIEDLVAGLDSCASAPVYPFLKRQDEKFVTEQQYENPKFVEDVARDAIAYLRTVNGISGFDLEIESLESIHGHNVWASHQEQF